MSVLLGLDVGSSFLKAAILHLDDGTIGETKRVPFPDFVPGPPLHREVSPSAILAAVESLLAQFPPSDGLMLCGQMHGFVLTNPRGEPVSNYISWLDQRVSPAAFEAMRARLTDHDLAEIGNEFRSSIAICQLAHMHAEGVTPVSIADFVASRLCRTSPIMDPTQAAAFGALRLGTLEWHETVIAKLGLSGVCWPRVLPSGSVVGTWHGHPVYSSVGDQQCALAGALLSEGEVSVNIGTGSQIAVLTKHLPTDGLQTRPYFGDSFLRTITHIPGGRALSALVGLLTELGSPAPDQAWNYIEGAVQQTPSTDLEASLSYYPGPCGNTGFLQNLHEGNLTVGHVFRAAFEAMAANYQSCLQRLDPDKTVTSGVFSGGVARRLLVLRELTQQASGLPFRLSPHPEDTMFGLLVLGRRFHAGSA
ncbi:MAG: hypothetical protein JO022_19155 [Acidobacteriaceae bacterium]|nr:hypothetical protein [Acidobacteriaceae bacterium]